MAKFKAGSNREIVYKILTNKPQSIENISASSGLSVKATTSVLVQIRPMGLSRSLKALDGSTGWTLGKSKESKDRKTVSDVSAKIVTYFQAAKGKAVTLDQICKDLNLSSLAHPRKVLSDLAKTGELSKSAGRPPKWMANDSIDTLPAIQLPPQQTLLPDVNAVMQASTAISTLMQSEQQKIIYQQTLQQILVIYEQLGNILEMAGLIED